jgi:site-specific DNA-methyltransferase (adenine-specific)
MIHLGNCLDILKTIDNNSIDLILTDLPYGITRAKWDSEIPLDLLWIEYKRVIKKNCPIVLFAAQPFTSILISSNLSWFKYCWYWEKEQGTGFLNTSHQPLRFIEEICVFSEKKGTYNPQMIELDKPRKNKLAGKSELTNQVASFNSETVYKTYTHSFPKNILKFSRDKKRYHSMQKPIKLIEYLIKTHCNEKDVVLDSTMGSGTTGVACKNLNREFIGIELDENIFNIAKKRIEEQFMP